MRQKALFLATEETAEPNSNSRGFSLTEALIALAIISILGGAIVSIFFQSQSSYRAQNAQAERIQQMRIAMDHITRCFRQAGNDPLETLGSSPVTQLDNGTVRILTDITGSTPSNTENSVEATGDPDGRFDSLYENVTIRYEPGSRRVYSNVGYGEQVLAERISHLNFTFYDLGGNPTTTPSSIARVKVQMVGESDHADMQSGLTNTVTLESDVFIRSRMPQVFIDGDQS